MNSIKNNAKEDKQQLPYKIIEQKIEEKIIHIYLSTSIGDPKDYIDLVHSIKTANKSDTIHIYLNTPGGRLDTGVQIINAMKHSKARIICILEGRAYSLGALIFLSSSEFVVNDHARLMIHNHSGSAIGKGHEYMAAAQDTVEWFEKMSRDIFKDFLTDKEIQEILDGKDFWLQANEVRERLEKMIKIQEKREKAKEKENDNANKKVPSKSRKKKKD